MGESHDPKNLTLYFPLETMIQYSQIQDAWKFHRTLTILIMGSHFTVLWPCSKKLFKKPSPQACSGWVSCDIASVTPKITQERRKD